MNEEQEAIADRVVKEERERITHERNEKIVELVSMLIRFHNLFCGEILRMRRLRSLYEDVQEDCARKCSHGALADALWEKHHSSAARKRVVREYILDRIILDAEAKLIQECISAEETRMAEIRRDTNAIAAKLEEMRDSGLDPLNSACGYKRHLEYINSDPATHDSLTLPM